MISGAIWAKELLLGPSVLIVKSVFFGVLVQKAVCRVVWSRRVLKLVERSYVCSYYYHHAPAWHGKWLFRPLAIGKDPLSWVCVKNISDFGVGGVLGVFAHAKMHGEFVRARGIVQKLMVVECQLEWGGGALRKREQRCSFVTKRTSQWVGWRRRVTKYHSLRELGIFE